MGDTAEIAAPHSLNNNRSVPKGGVGLPIQLEYAGAPATPAPIFRGSHEFRSKRGDFHNTVLAEYRDIPDIRASEEFLAFLEGLGEGFPCYLPVLALV